MNLYSAFFLTHDFEHGVWYAHIEDEQFGDTVWESVAYSDYREAELAATKELWALLGDVPCDEEPDGSLCIAEPFLKFDAGCDREEIWHWFEDTLGVSVAYLMGQCTDPYIR